MHLNDNITGGHTADEIIRSALRQIGMLGCGQSVHSSWIEACLPHLESLESEYLRDRQIMPQFTEVTADLAKRIAPEFGVLPLSLDPIRLEWAGDSIATMPPARDLLRASAASGPIDEQMKEKLFTFYGGEQWAPDVLLRRDWRPTLTINRLPILVAAALEADRKAGGHRLDPKELVDLILIITQRNMDAQRLYNYLASAQAEREAANLAKISYLKACDSPEKADVR